MLFCYCQGLVKIILSNSCFVGSLKILKRRIKMKNFKVFLLVSAIFLFFSSLASASYSFWGAGVEVDKTDYFLDLEMPSTVTGNEYSIGIGSNLGSTKDGEKIKITIDAKTGFFGNIRTYRENPWFSFDEEKNYYFKEGSNVVELKIGSSLESSTTLMIDLNLAENAGKTIIIKKATIKHIEADDSRDEDNSVDAEKITIIPFINCDNERWDEYLIIQNLSDYVITPHLLLYEKNGKICYDSSIAIKAQEKYRASLQDMSPKAVYGEIVYQSDKISCFLEQKGKEANWFQIFHLKLSAKTNSKLLLTFLDNRLLVQRTIILINPLDKEQDVVLAPKSKNNYLEEIRNVMVPAKSYVVKRIIDIFDNNQEIDQVEILSEEMQAFGRSGDIFGYSTFFLEADIMK